MAQVCLNIVATGVKQTGVYLGYTEYIQKTKTKTVNAPAVRLIATESLVNVAEPRLKVKG